MHPDLGDPEKNFVIQQAAKHRNYLATKIKVLSDWECVLNRPCMYIGKRSIYGLECFLAGLSMAKSNMFFEDAQGTDFNSWLRKKFPAASKTTFECALDEASGDDEKAFDIWCEWFKEYKNASKAYLKYYIKRQDGKLYIDSVACTSDNPPEPTDGFVKWFEKSDVVGWEFTDEMKELLKRW